MDQAFDINIFVTIIFALITVYLLFKFSTKNFKHWKERDIPYEEPLPFIGNFLKILTFRIQIGHYLAELYNKFSGPYFGIFIFTIPHLIIRCPNLVKLILVKDFQYFADRTVVSDEKSDALGSKFLFFVPNPEWKDSRNKMAPAFSTGKLKSMTILMDKVAEGLKEYVRKNLHKDSLEVKELFAKFATDIIASCAFGVDAHSFKSEDAEFRSIGRLVFGLSPKRSIIQTLAFVMPSFIKFFRIPFFDPKFTDFMRRMFWETFNERKKTNYKRNDLIDLVIQLQQKSKPGDPYEFVGDRVVAPAGQFFVAGFEAVSSVMAFTLYELCLQQDMQNKVREEIKCTISKHGKITYEGLKEMKYLDMIVYESLRKYPTLPFVDRICIQDYKVPNTNFVIEKGTPVYIPIFGLHYDSKYFPDPEKYNPERFSDENKNSFPEYAFIPFGKGPRSCIGARFGFLTSKIGLAHILSEFQIIRTAKTPVPMEFETKGFLIGSKRGLPIGFKKLS